MSKPQRKVKVYHQPKSNADTILCEARVIDVLPGAIFKVELKDLGDKNYVTATPSGKIRMNHIRILRGDYVTVELSTYDLTKGRITFRHKGPNIKPEE